MMVIEIFIVIYGACLGLIIGHLITIIKQYKIDKHKDFEEDLIYVTTALGYKIYIINNVSGHYAGADFIDRNIRVSKQLIQDTSAEQLTAVLLHEVGHLEDSNLNVKKYVKSRRKLIPYYYYKCECKADDFAIEAGYGQHLDTYFKSFIKPVIRKSKKSSYIERLTYLMRYRRIRKKLEEQCK